MYLYIALRGLHTAPNVWAFIHGTFVRFIVRGMEFAAQSCHGADNRFLSQTRNWIGSMSLLMLQEDKVFVSFSLEGNVGTM